MTNRKDHSFSVYLGTTKDKYNPEKVYLTGFKWDCGWYWGGGHIQTRTMHSHFDGCFLETIDERGHSLGNFVSPWNPNANKEGYKVVSGGASIWESLSFFLDDAQFSEEEWWRVQDLYKQFYVLKEAAEVFQYGGHCTSRGRSRREISKSRAKAINDHIEKVLIPQIEKALKVKTR